MEKEDDIEESTEIADLQIDVNICRKTGYRIEEKYLSRMFTNRLYGLKNIQFKRNLCDSEGKESSPLAPMNSELQDQDNVPQRTNNLADKKSRILKEADNILTAISIINTQKRKKQLEKRKYFEELLDSVS